MEVVIEHEDEGATKDEGAKPEIPVVTDLVAVFAEGVRLVLLLLFFGYIRTPVEVWMGSVLLLFVLAEVVEAETREAKELTEK